MDQKEFRRNLRKTQTSAESKFWNLVRGRAFEKLKFRRQHSIERFTVDFYCHELQLVIEIDGNVHDNLGQNLYDEERTRRLEKLGYNVLGLIMKQS